MKDNQVTDLLKNLAAVGLSQAAMWMLKLLWVIAIALGPRAEVPAIQQDAILKQTKIFPPQLEHVVSLCDWLATISEVIKSEILSLSTYLILSLLPIHLSEIPLINDQ